MSDAHAPHAPQFAGSDPHETLSTDEYKHFHVHVTPFWPMFWVFAILLFLTALTVWSSNVHGIQVGNTWIAFSGLVHILIAMGIAVVKATLVGAYFMHLKYDKPMNTVVVSATIFGVVLFIGLSMLDLSSRALVDPIQSGEIYKGGNYKLYAGSNSDETSPLARKPDANAAKFAQDEAKANAGNHALNEEHATQEPHSDAPAEDHAPQPH